MSEGSAADEATIVMLRAFQQRLTGSVPFREDAQLVSDLLVEAEPVLETLRRAYQQQAAQAGMHEGFALFHLLCRRAGLLLATPTTSLALAHAVRAGLAAGGVALDDAQHDALSMVAVEGYTAGRDEQRERQLRLSAANSQVCCALGPRCAALFLSGAQRAEQLTPALEQLARELYRADLRALLLDVSRLQDADEEVARAVANLIVTLASLGTEVLLCGAASVPRLDTLQQAAQLVDSFGAGLTRALRTAGLELRQRRRFGDLIERVRSGVR